MTQAPPKRTGGPREEAARNTIETRPQSAALPQFLQDLIACPPQHGEGVHQWLFKVARHLHAHRDQETIVSLLAAACDGCGRHVPQGEVVAAVESARACAWAPNNGTAGPGTKPAPKWPTVDQVKRKAAIQSAGMDVATLWDRSPITMAEMDAEWYIGELFPNNPLLCCGRDMRTFTTAPRERFRGRLGELALIVPSPMSALTGTRKADGKTSAHTLSNAGARHYLITEFDEGSADEQAATIWHLEAFAPLVMVLSSGGKSLHAWWDCRGVDESAVGQFFRYAVTLGADPATWPRSQFVRLPEGWRHDKGTRQQVYWFDLEAVGKGAPHE